METRIWMINVRKSRNLTVAQMASRLHVSEGLVRIVEEGGVTHQNIVKRMKNEYRLTESQAEELLPMCRRPNGGDYDPDRYVIAVEDFVNFHLW